jgi:hypothetical protein
MGYIGNREKCFENVYMPVVSGELVAILNEGWKGRVSFLIIVLTPQFI